MKNELRWRPTLAELEEKIKLRELRAKNIPRPKSKSTEPSGVERIDDEYEDAPAAVDDMEDENMLAIHQTATFNNSSSNSFGASMQQRSSTNNATSIHDDDTDVDTSIVSTATSECSFDTQIAANANDIADLNDDDEDEEESNGGITVADDDDIGSKDDDDNDDNDDDDGDDDDCDEKDVLESFDRIIEEENKIINGTDIMREEELVEFKERCIKLTDENISLRKEIDSLRVSGNKNMSAIIYTASLAILLIYYLLSMIFS